MVQHVEPGGELAIDLTLDQSDLVMDAGGCAELGDELFLRITFIAKVPAGSKSQFSRFGRKRVASSRCSRLGSTMFGLLQLPFADLRCLADDRFGRVPRPDWD